MEFVKLAADGTVAKYPVSLDEIKDLHPDLQGLDEDSLRAVGYESATVQPVSHPETINFKNVVESFERDEETGSWLVTLKQVSRFSNEEEKNAAVEQKWQEVREYRNDLLQKADIALTRSNELRALGEVPETNPMVISDSDLLGAYSWKQELRDITKSPNPWGIQWPVKPNSLII